MQYRLNFITTTADLWRRKRIQRFVLFVYFVLLTSTGFIFFKLYDSFEYMADILSSKVLQIEHKISDIEPRIILLENKIEHRNTMRQQTAFHTQIDQRPSIWCARLRDIADLLPPEMILNQISYRSKDQSSPKIPAEFTLTGHLVIKNSEQDIFMVDQFRSDIADSPSIQSSFGDVYLKNNNIFKEKDDLKLTFSMVFDK